MCWTHRRDPKAEQGHQLGTTEMAPVPGPWWLQSDLSDGSPGAEKWSHSRPKDRKAGSGVTEVSGLSLVTGTRVVIIVTIVVLG